MILGSEVVVMSIDEARILLNTLHLKWTKEKIKQLQKEGSLTTINNLQTVVRCYDDKENEVG